MTIEFYIAVGLAYWMCFWSVAKLSQYDQSQEFASVFLSKRSRLVKFVLFLLWPFLAPLAMVFITLANIASL